MDFWIIAGVTMLVGWAWVTFTTTAPGWVHLFLTLGVFLIIWRIVVRGTSVPADAASADAPRNSVRAARKR